MRLTDEQQGDILGRLGNLWKGTKSCPICGVERWDVSSNVFALDEFEGKTPTIARMSIPVVVVICENCGYMLQFNAVVLGLVDPKDYTR